MTTSLRQLARAARRGRTPLRETLRMPPVPEQEITAYRPRTEELVERIVDRILDEVAGYAATDRAMAEGMHDAISCAVELFVDAVSGAPACGREVFGLFEALGREEARGGRSLDGMRAALYVATQESWEDLRRAAAEFGTSPEVSGALGDALLGYHDLLLEHAVHGYLMTQAPAERDHSPARSQLLAALISGADPLEVDELARRCEWPLPERMSVIVTDPEVADCARFPADAVLVDVDDDRLTVIAPPRLGDQIAAGIARSTGSVVAVSWAVPITQVPDALRWAARGRDLARQGVIPVERGRPVRCADHHALLCLHADPALRTLADEAVLAPLWEQSPKRRAVLATTMLLWLQTRESAPRLAERLGVHHHTVRNRLRAIQALFEEQLADPSRTLELLTALESVASRGAAPGQAGAFAGRPGRSSRCATR